jgi:hypothetical protein
VPAEVLASILRQIGVLASLWCFIDCSPQSAGIEKKRIGLASLWRFGRFMMFLSHVVVVVIFLPEACRMRAFAFCSSLHFVWSKGNYFVSVLRVSC